MMISVVFVDRDGMIGGNGHFTPISEFVPYVGSVAGIRALRKAGIQVFALTNQTRIAAGQLDEGELHQSLLELGCSDAFICPHAENAGCSCRKPKTGLITQAHLKYTFANEEAVIIGDSYRADMQCASRAGILGIHVATGRGDAGRTNVDGNFVECADLAAGADWILRHNRLKKRGAYHG